MDSIDSGGDDDDDEDEGFGPFFNGSRGHRRGHGSHTPQVQEVVSLEALIANSVPAYLRRSLFLPSVSLELRCATCRRVCSDEDSVVGITHSVPATAGTTTVRQFFQRFTQTQALQQPQAGTVAYCSAECAAQGLAERGRQLVLPDSRRSSKASASAAAFSAGSNPEAKAPPSKRAKPSPQPQQQQVQPQPHQDDLKMCSQCHRGLKTEMFSGTQLKKKGKRKCNDCVEP